MQHTFCSEPRFLCLEVAREWACFGRKLPVLVCAQAHVLFWRSIACLILALKGLSCSGACRAASAAGRAQAALERAAGDAVEDAVLRAEAALAEAEAAESRAAAAAAVATAHEEVAGSQAGAAEQVGAKRQW